MKCTKNGKPTHLTEEEKTMIADSVNKNTLRKFAATDLFEFDNKHINGQYLINNIEWAFFAWTNAPWKEKVPFDLFCEYVLPYRVIEEPISYWRGELTQRLLPSVFSTVDDPITFHWKNHLNTTYFKLTGEKKFVEAVPFHMNFKQLETTKAGICPHRCSYVINHLRAMGIPATYDYVPNWGNRNLDHVMVGLATQPKQVEPLLSNENRQIEIDNNISSAQSTFEKLNYSANDLPKGLYIQYIKTIPKVYRRTWSGQKEMFDLFRDIPQAEIHSQLFNLAMKDVTDQYVECADVYLAFERKQTFSIAYLAVFDNKDWKPVAMTRIRNGIEATFAKMGANIVYLPVALNNGQTQALAPPFLLTPSGEMEFFEGTGETQDFRLIRKYPFFSNTAQFPAFFKGGKFEASNCPNFKNPVSLHKIDYNPFYMNSFEVKISGSFRYYRYCPPEGGRSDVAEIEWWGLLNNEPVKFSGSPIGNESEVDNLKLAFDGNYETYFRPWGRDRWVGVDFGERIKLTKIRFCPRNDANCIIPGNEYELFYWGNMRWNSLGKQVASDDYLTYKSVPAGTLYWLRCHTEGKEERIFTYENGRQIWW